MSAAAYPEYKDCGISWLASLPSHWRLKQLKHVAAVIPSNVDKHSKDGELSVSLCNYTDVYYRDRITEEINFMRATASRSEIDRFRLLADDIVVTKDSETADDIGVPSYVPDALPGVLCGYHLSIIRPTAHSIGRFLKYVLLSDPTRYYFEISAKGLTRVGLSQGALGNTPIPTPPRREQEIIADFLDHETGRIDALIEEQQRLIALLKEDLHTSLADSVTKGLNPIAPKRETEISDLPTIPEHWRLTKAKFLIREFEQGWSPQCENTPARDDSDWAVLKVGAVNGGIFRPNENKRLPEELEGIPRLTVRTGNLLVSRANTRELVGSAAVVGRDHDRLMVSDKLYRIRLNETTCVPEFLSAYLQTQHPRREIEFEATGASSSMLNIGQDVIRELLVPTPPIDEQKEIVDWIAERQHQYETLMHTVNRSIELLRERRQATISAAITGRIDVRNWVQRMTSNERELPCAAEEGASYG